MAREGRPIFVDNPHQTGTLNTSNNTPRRSYFRKLSYLRIALPSWEPRSCHPAFLLEPSPF
jgi:hypothetical protein